MGVNTEQRCFCMKVPFYIRQMMAAVWAVLCGILRLFSADAGIFVVFIVAGVWLQMYLAGIYIEISNRCIVKHSGRIFRRKTVIPVRNICWVQTRVFRAYLPAVMKIVYPHQNVYILGFTGRQMEKLMETVLRL